ncbi:uncharacterized protein LAESUDRAFT_754347 [Laetiporus sulphureus 93-53]|uniref:Uncharacterized protein n=1 Tax=Laetiporus sulphureus 93-53 TaxID=1314785 RepID=A0A165HJ26_9APHY|nr:uncharacterized protein LAESUDRAFT_754347 [Laetiporus sulphureus 93-53]KZT11792.1 hypothetical protein LAESUDRAFT_754347 [Laetiporus sulphureus 93-53]
MALTATAQSALREPAWDEVIVPTLRKRLQDESKVLARRISAASVGSADDLSDLYNSNAFISRQDAATPPAQHSSNHKPSAIPRPSLQQSRTAMDSPNAVGQPPQPPRSRSLSQPLAFDSPKPAESPHLQTGSSSSRPTSPMVNGRTRIPVSRGRAGSASSHARGSTNGSKTDEDFWPAEGGPRSYSTRTTVRMPRHKASELFDEPAPYSANSSATSHPEYEQDNVACYRISSDSEERPYEHWYRGDVSRNGGVGELRVGKREEMLDIASYGHSFRKASSRLVYNGYTRSRSNSTHQDLAASQIATRRRSGSMGAMLTQSAYSDDEDAHAQDLSRTLNDEDVSNVLDEHPPTDVESTEEQALEPYNQDVVPHPNGTISSPSLALIHPQAGHHDPGRQRTTSTSISRIPTPTSQRQRSPIPRTPTPTKALASSATSSTRLQPLPRSQSQPQTQIVSQRTAAKRRAKSPATSTPSSAAKKAKTKSPPSAHRKIIHTVENRRSIGQYPTPDGDGLVDAIPYWTQPVPPSGNWDDVVLPVVARKKGLESHYVPADGSPRPRKTNSGIYEPAPGTFGYDPSKARRRELGKEVEQIPMEELDQKVDVVTEEPSRVTESPKPQPPLQMQPQAQPESTPIPSSNSELDRARSRPSLPPSPPPFAHYAAGTAPRPIDPPIVQAFPEAQAIRQDVQEDGGGSGCCKCIIM